MRVPVSWLAEFTEVAATPAEIGDALTRCGFELASIETVPDQGDGPGDTVLDFEITANRPDCLSIRGMAREVALAFRQPFEPRARRRLTPSPNPISLPVTIEAPALCPRYTAALADVRVGPSPPWLAARLHAAGIRAINNVVDVTNYVLVELGHPIHAFDLHQLEGPELRIRQALAGESITTLDGQLRTLTEGMLVIADRSRPQAVAGVMGGLASEVTLSTRTIAIESAYFAPAAVRRTSKRLELSTEASYRFERGADIEAPLVALARVCELLEEIGAGQVTPGFVDVYPTVRGENRVPLRASRVAQLLGQDVPAPEIERILRALGFALVTEPEASTVAWRVAVPSWRGDVTREIDLIEEIARHHGLDRLPVTFPPLTVSPARLDVRLERDAVVRRVAASTGFTECVTFTFIERSAAEPFADASELVAIANPLSETFAVLRPSLIPGLVESVAHNRRRERKDVRLFETGSRFTRTSGESRAIALAWLGSATGLHWSGTDRPADFYDMSGIVEQLGRALGVGVRLEPASSPAMRDGHAALIHASHARGSALVGLVGQLREDLAAAHGVPPAEHLFVAEIDLDAMAALVDLGEHVEVVPLPRHPSVVRDLSLVVPAGLPAATLRATMLANAPETLVNLVEFARYQGKGVPEGHVSLSFRLTFRSPDRTLTDTEVHRAAEAIVAALAAEHGARLR
ncbi:MAG: pheT [Acidobacteria bacterium]|nr:pheT [Acidobacteriota bacterium]